MTPVSSNPDVLGYGLVNRIESNMEKRNNRSISQMSGVALLLISLGAGCTSRYEQSNGTTSFARSSTMASLQVKAKGNLEFTEDETDIRSISPEGYLLIKERQGFTLRKFEAVQEPGKALRRSYFFRGRPHELDEEARAWLARILPEIIRETGVSVDARAKKLLKQGGPQAVFEEISRTKNDRGKRLYFKELFESGVLTSHDLQQQAMRQVSQEIGSDGEKASLLSEVADLYLEDDAVRPSFFEAVETIASDGERVGLLSALLAKKQVRREALIQMLKSATSIGSDGEKAGFLTQAVKVCSRDDAVISTLLETARTIGSDGEKSDVLSALFKKEGLSHETLAKTLNVAATISSDGEKARVLEEAAKVCPNNDGVLSVYIATASTISSDGEHGRVLSVLLDKGDLSQAILKQALQSIAQISSDGEKATVLEQAVELCSRDEALLSTFVGVVETLASDGEYRRVMSALNRVKPAVIPRSKG
jgi:hypothetical protein